MAETKRPLKVFLCHASTDKLVVRELYQRLAAEQWIDPWLDEEKILPGQDWNLEIEKAVENAHAVIVCLSKNSVSKEGYIQKELRFVLDIADEKPEGEIFVIPIRLDDCQVPRRLKAWQYINYFPKENVGLTFNRLLTSLKQRNAVVHNKGIDSSEGLTPGNLGNEIEQRKAQRFLYLKRLYELSKSNTLSYFQFTEIGREFGWKDDLTDRITDYLKDEGLIDFPSFGTVSITHAGIKFVEDALEKLDVQPSTRSNQSTTSILKAVTITIDRDIDEFTFEEQRKFINSLSTIIKTRPEQIQIITVAKGSVILTVEIPEESAQRFLSQFLEGNGLLDELRIKKVELKPSKETPSSHENKPHKIIQPILFLCADPSNTSRLRLGEEVREIREKLQLAKLRESFDLEERFSVRPVDISQALLDVQPNIVHFSGHGSSTGGLYFENKMGESHLVDINALAALFEQFATIISCVVLNACYSATQANAIVQHIPYVIGMNKEIGDKASIAFSVGFYQALGAGRSIEDAYKLGCVQIRLENIPEHLTPVLIKKSDTSAKIHPQPLSISRDFPDSQIPTKTYETSSHTSTDNRSLIITRVFQVTDKYFEDKSEPQRIIVQFTNTDEKETVTINKIRYSQTGLGMPESALLSSYAREGIGHRVIPFDENQATVLPGQNFIVELKLGQIWKRADINKWIGKLGYLKIDITYKGEQFEWFSVF